MPVLAIVNELLAAAQRIAPKEDLIRAIEPRKGATPQTLLVLIDQILVSLVSKGRDSEF